MRQLALLLGAVVSLTAPAVAHAFSEPALYPEPTPTGGGGGRYFTGSPLDAYSCAVCHEGGEKPTVSLRGFPDSYQPGKSYEVELRWTQPSDLHALNLEVVDTEGRAAGKLALPDSDELDEDDRCVLAEDEAIRELQASYLVEHGVRTIVGVRGCGARSLHFTFTAPNEAKIALTASVVRSDHSEDTEGDGVLELRQIAFRDGEARAESAGCSLAGGSSSLGGLAAILSVLGPLLSRRRAQDAAR